MSRRASPTQRIVEFFLSVSLAEAKQALDVARTLVATREAQEGHPGEMRPARKPRPKAATAPAEDRVQ